MNDTVNQAPKLTSYQNTTTFLAKQGKSLFRSSSPSHIAELEAFNFNYSNLPLDLARELKNTTTNIRVQYRNALQSLSAVGLQLIKTKDLLPRGDWVNWVKQEFEEPGYFSIYTAENYMNLARLVQAHGLENLKNLPLSVLYILSREQEEEFVEKILTQSKESSISRTRYNQIKAEHKSQQNIESTLNPLTVDVNTVSLNFDNVSSVVNESIEVKSETITPIIIDYAELTDAVIEQEETISYKFISSLKVKDTLFDYIFYPISDKNCAIKTPQIFEELKFLMKDCALCFVYGSPLELNTIIQEAHTHELNYLTSIVIKNDTTFRPDLNLSCNWNVCVLLYLYKYPVFEEYLKDYYLDVNSFIYSILRALPKKDKVNSLLIQSKSISLFHDEDILFQLSNHYSHFVYQN